MAGVQHVEPSVEDIAEPLREAAAAEQVPAAEAQPDTPKVSNGGTNTPDALLVPKAGMKAPPPLKNDHKSLQQTLRCKTTGVWINNAEGKTIFVEKHEDVPNPVKVDVPLDNELQNMCNQLGVHMLFQHWLAMYGLTTTQLVGMSSAVEDLDEKVFCIALQKDDLQISLGDQSKIAQLFSQCRSIGNADTNMEPADGTYSIMLGVSKSLDAEWIRIYHTPLQTSDKLMKGIMHRTHGELHSTPPKHGLYHIGILKMADETKAIGANPSTTTVVDGKLMTQVDYDCTSTSLHQIETRIMGHFDAVSWCCLGKSDQTFWTARDNTLIRKLVMKMLYEKHNGQHLTVEYAKICWDATQRIISENVEIGMTVGEAWRNPSSYQAKWMNPPARHEGAGDGESAGGKGKKRRNVDDHNPAEKQRRKMQSDRDNARNKLIAKGKGKNGSGKQSKAYGKDTWQTHGWNATKKDAWNTNGWNTKRW